MKAIALLTLAGAVVLALVSLLTVAQSAAFLRIAAGGLLLAAGCFGSSK